MRREEETETERERQKKKENKKEIERESERERSCCSECRPQDHHMGEVSAGASSRDRL